MSQEVVSYFTNPEAQYCRLCLAISNEDNHQELFPLFELTEVIEGMLEALANIKILEDDQFSKLICIDCWEMLAEIKKFKNVVQISDLKLKDELTRNISVADTMNKSLNQSDEELETNNVTKPSLEESTDVGEELESVDEKIDIHEIDLAEIKRELQDSDDETVEDELLVNVNRHELIKKDPFSTPEKKAKAKIKPTKSEKNIKVNNVGCSFEKYKCSVCNREFSKSRARSKHELTHNTKRCKICNYYTKRRNGLFKHSLWHLREKNYECQTCGVILRTKQLWSEHQETHIIKCIKCNTIFETPDELVEHDKDIHPGLVKDDGIRCERCNKTFETFDDLKVHVSKGHRGIQGLCDICGKEVTNLQCHINTHLKPYKCNICNTSYGNKYSLKAHLDKHIDKKFRCDVCGKELASKKTLCYHKIGIHTKEKRFECDICDKRFHFKQTLQGHRRSHLLALK